MNISLKISVILLLIISLIHSSQIDTFQYEKIDDSNSEIHFELEDLQIITENGMDRIKSTSLSTTTEGGLPELPVYSFLYEIDADMDYTTIYRIIRSHTVENIDLYPMQMKVPGESAANSIFQKNVEFYNSDMTFPSENIEISDPQIMRDLSLISISFTPFTYDVSTKTLEVFDEVVIEINSIETARSNTGPRQIPTSRVFSQVFERSVVNYDRNRSISDTPVILYICGGNSLSNPYMQALIEWRHQRGYQVEAVSTSAIGGSTSAIKSYIQSAYDNWATPPDFVCLVGDSGGSYSIPSFTETWSGYGGDGDHPYSQLSGNDILADVIFGRLSVRSTTDLSVVVNKIIKYEQGYDLNSNWTEKAALIGDPGSSGISTVITNESIENTMEQYGMTDVRHKYSGGSWSSWMQNQLNEGVLYFNYRGYYGVSGFGGGNIDGANNGYKLPFATVITCGTGSFASETTALSEKFLRAGTVSNPKGGIASIGTATLGTHTLFNNIFDMGVYHGLFVLGNETAGEALNSGKFALYETYPSNPNNYTNIFTHWNNLMGDPATHLWTDTPVEITADYPETVNMGQDVIQVWVIDENDQPVENARVTLVKDDDNFFSNSFTDESGYVSIPLYYSSGGNMDITITKRNVVPLREEIYIPSNGIELSIHNSEILIIDDGSDGTSGNSDGDVNPGETFLIDLPLYNFSDEPISGLSCSLSSISQEFEVLGEPVLIPFLPGLEHQSIQFLCTVSPSAVFRQEMAVILVIDSESEGSWNIEIPVDVFAPNLYISDILISSGVENLEPGGIGTIQVEIFNNGSDDISDLTGEIIVGNNLIEVTSGELTWPTIPAGTSEYSEGGLVVSVDSNVINGTVLNVGVHLTSDSGYDRTEIFNVTIGELTVNDPMGPDSYGYYIYDMGDDNYDLAPDYDWIEIDPGYGGNGTELSINDGGNNQDDSQVLSLPFSFKFYGEDYDQITVCSNGWIAFGSSPLESFRNYTLPGPGGPAPMLAVFWDDLKTTNGGDVFSYYDAANGRLIIEWSDMRTYDENSLESFQAILYDVMVPPYGDGEIKLQYKEFNNTTNGNYYSAIHGAYSTIGIENHWSDTGLEYTFNNEYSPAAAPLYDESALFITTRLAEILPVPEVTFNADNFYYELMQDESYSDNLIISNTGEPESILYYAVEHVGMPYPAGPPDNFGHNWTDTDVDPEFNYSWIDISEVGIALTFPHNDIATDPIDMGFSFPFYGETYNQCIVSPNGWIGFGDDNNAWQNIEIPSAEAPRPAIFPFWDDLNPINEGNSSNMDGEVYYYASDEYFIVWFGHVAHWSGEIDGNYNFQAILYPNGDIRYNYDDLEGTINRATIGIQNGAGDDAIEIVNDDDYVHEGQSVIIKPSAEWLDIISPDGELSGSIFEGESVNITLDIQSAGLVFGDYSTLIKVNTNIQPAVNLPILLSVIEETTQLGDLDHDYEVNVIDIVILVNIVLGETIPNEYQLWAADMNEDNIIDVLDIVQLVNIILEQ